MSAEAGVSLEQTLDLVRATAPAAASGPSKEVDSRLPLAARAKGHPRSASPTRLPAEGKTGATPAPEVRAASPAPEAAQPAPSAAAAVTHLGTSKLESGLAALQQLLQSGPDDADSILAHMPAPAVGNGATAGAGASPAGQLQAPHHADPADLQENPTFRRTSDTGDAAGLGSWRLQILTLMDQRCEATEAKCQALVATRAEMTKELISQVQCMATGQQEDEVAAVVRGYEARLAALEEHTADSLRAAAHDCRAAVAALEARVEAQQRAQEEGLARINNALLASE